MVKAVTLYVHNTRELRIAKNFIILSFLFGIVGIVLSHSFPGVIARIVIPLISLVIGIIGFYKISKLARSTSLFKNFSFSILTNLVAGVILILDVRYQLPIVFLYFILIVLNFYWAYKFFAELSVLSDDKFFVNGFRIICCSLVLLLLFINFPNLDQLAFFIFSLILIGCGCIFFGFFRLKQITYFVFSEDV